MKSKLLKLTIAAFVAMTINANAQATLGADIVNNGFETWSGSVPTGWEVAPANTIGTNTVSSVAQVTNSNTVTPVQSGNFSCKLKNTGSSYTTGVLAGTGVSVTQGMGYAVSYYARGKGTISCEITDGSATSANYVSATNGQSVSGKGWHHYYQTVIAPTTTNNAQFCLKVKSTGTYTSSTFPLPGIVGIDVDSFVVKPYTPIPASLYNIQYTTASNGNSPFYGQFVSQTGGIVSGLVLSNASTISTPTYNGYYIQTSGSTAWAAALVFDQTNGANLAVGDSVTFMASVDEYFNMTELVQVSNFNKVSSGNPVPSLPLNTQTFGQEQYEGFLINVQGATVNTYSATAPYNYGQGTLTDASGVPGTFDFKGGFYAPHGSATAGSSGNAGYAPIVGTSYCVTGNVNLEFSAYNIVPRDSADIVKNCVALGVEKHNSLNANLYPNPVANELNIQLPFAATKVNVSIIDVMGRDMIAPVSASGTNINVNNLNIAAGTYFVKITADGKTQISKIVKQ